MKSLADFRDLTDLPIVPKGIKTAKDAKTCLDLGFPAIYVSNHGGRTLDGAPTSVEILLDIRKNAPEVFEGMEVYADGGVRRGNHVITLLALGATAVGLGRSPMYANIWGEEGVTKMIDMLATELNTTMQLMGASDTSKLNSSYVSRVSCVSFILLIFVLRLILSWWRAFISVCPFINLAFSPSHRISIYRL